MTNQSAEKRNTLTDALSWLGTIGLAYAVFIGMIYAHGSVWIASVGGVTVLLLVSGIRFYLLKLKKVKESYKNKLPERVVLAAFVVVIIAATVYVLHYIDIDFQRKATIKDLGKAKLEFTTDMVAAAVNFAENKVDSFNIRVDQRLEDYLNNHYNDQERWTALSEVFSDGDTRIAPNLMGKKYYYTSVRESVERKLRRRVTEAKQTDAEFLRDFYNVNFLKAENAAYLKNTLPVFDQWKFLSVNYVYSDIDRHYAALYKKALSRMGDFSFPALPKKDLYLNDPFYALKNGNVTTLLCTLLAMAILTFLILSDYLFFRRKLPKVHLIDQDEGEEDEDDLRKKRILERTKNNP
ncbi:MAG: hypothetical protein AAFO69_04190 [Bacteroidota bacterium]